MSNAQIGNDPYVKQCALLAGLKFCVNPAVPDGEVWFLSSIDGKVQMKIQGLEKERD